MLSIGFFLLRARRRFRFLDLARRITSGSWLGAPAAESDVLMVTGLDRLARRSKLSSCSTRGKQPLGS